VKEAYDYAKAQSATLIACKYPNTGNINNPSEREKNLKTYTTDVYKLNDEKFGFKDVYNHTDGFNDEYIRSIYSIDDQILDENGILVPSDQTGTHVNVINRMRYTVANPEIFDTTVHVFGPSYIFCTGSEDSGTLTSHMQHFFNIDKTYDKNAKSVRVLNYSICGDHRFFSIDRLKQANIRKGDIVIFFFYVMVASGQTTRLNKSIEQRLILNEIPFFDLNYSLNRPHNYGEVFIDEDHLAPKGNKVVAKELYSLIKQKEEINEKLIPKINNLYAEVSKRIIPEHNSQLEAYIESIKHFAKNKNDIGAIVVNANPFTNGHKYLVSKAAETVDYLYVFVVKEDKSFFKFSDRFSLVQQGVSDIKNVAVISGGKFIISSVTFPEYFNKDNLREMTIDASDDLTIFCEKICPALNIKKRFVGEEPFCPVTRQYNEQMKKILPQFGIELVEIERVASNDHKISASYVRKLLAEKNFEIIKEIVPETTYNFLYRNYNE
jgi:[citrate (pro-3S)-lyase] ligase